MASVAKFRLNDAPRLLSHCSRTQKNHGSHIDDERTPLNFNMAAEKHPGMSDYQFAKNRVHDKNVKMLNRDDVKAVCSWAVTLPRELCHEVIEGNGDEYYEPNDIDECREFFMHAYDFLKNKHGEQNVISAYVHMDENVPHMHFTFTPIVKSKDGHGFKVCAKEALQDCYGAKFQIELQDYISANMGKELHMVKKDTVDYERNVKELKKKTLNARCVYLARQISKAEEELERKRAVLNVADKAIEAGKVDNARVVSSNGFTVMKDEEWVQIQNQLRFINSMKAERKEIRKVLNEFENKNDAAEIDDLRQQSEQLMRQNQKLSAELQRVQQFMANTEIEKGKSLMDLYYEKQNDSVNYEKER